MCDLLFFLKLFNLFVFNYSNDTILNWFWIMSNGMWLPFTQNNFETIYGSCFSFFFHQNNRHPQTFCLFQLYWLNDNCALLIDGKNIFCQPKQLAIQNMLFLLNISIYSPLFASLCVLGAQNFYNHINDWFLNLCVHCVWFKIDTFLCYFILFFYFFFFDGMHYKLQSLACHGSK